MHQGETTTTSTTTTPTTSTTTTQNLETCNFCINFHVDIFVDFTEALYYGMLSSSFSELLVNGGWGIWGAYGKCSRLCGGGEKTRKRSCNKPVPSNGGLPCLGQSVQSAKCNTKPCRESIQLTQIFLIHNN